MTFAGQIALVTGANQGLGLELTRQLAAAKATVYATALDVTAGAAALVDFPGDIWVIPLNLTQPATLTQLANSDSPLKDDICPAYQSSKIALNALTVLYAKEFRNSDTRVNSVCPGWVMTDMGHNEDLPDYGDAARPMTPEEAVAAYLWLIEPGDGSTCGFFTGCNRVAW